MATLSSLDILNSQLASLTTKLGVQQNIVATNTGLAQAQQTLVNRYISQNRCKGDFSSPNVAGVPTIRYACWNDLPGFTPYPGGKETQQLTTMLITLKGYEDAVTAAQHTINDPGGLAQQIKDTNAKIAADPAYATQQAVAVSAASAAAKNTTIKYIVVGIVVVLIALFIYHRKSK